MQYVLHTSTYQIKPWFIRFLPWILNNIVHLLYHSIPLHNLCLLHLYHTVPRMRAINFTQIPFYLDNLRETEDFIRVIKSVRNISSYYETEGLPNYPMGVPFTFWEQYLDLRFYLGLTIASVLGASFLVITIMLVNPRAALILVSTTIHRDIVQRYLFNKIVFILLWV